MRALIPAKAVSRLVDVLPIGVVGRFISFFVTT
jgi:hypothetical protein